MPNHWWVVAPKIGRKSPNPHIAALLLGQRCPNMRNSRHVSFLVPFVSINEQLRRGPEVFFSEETHAVRDIDVTNERNWQKRNQHPNWIIMREGITLRTHKSYNVLRLEFLQSQVAACRIVPGLPWISISLIVLLTLGLRPGGIAVFFGGRLSHNSRC